MLECIVIAHDFIKHIGLKKQGFNARSTLDIRVVLVVISRFSTHYKAVFLHRATKFANIILRRVHGCRFVSFHMANAMMEHGHMMSTVLHLELM